MMWPLRNRAYLDPYALEVARRRAEPDRGAILDALPDDAARAVQCRRWQAEARNAYVQGQRETIEDVLLSGSDQYAALDVEGRVRVGRIRWSSSPVAKNLAGDEQLYSRWSTMYDLRARGAA